MDHSHRPGGEPQAGSLLATPPQGSGDGSSFFRRVLDGPRVPASPTPTSLEAGATVGDFRLIEPLGAGGMGQVWEAEEISLGRRVALKLVRPELVSERTLELFAREARAAGRLNHPGIVQVHASGEADGVHWISQELVDGGWTLRDFIDDMRNAESRPQGYYTEVAEFTAQLADALQAAHDAGVIHRDIKPQNILISPDDRPRVTDFGVARVTDELGLSQTGDVLGTYHYMSPEQVRGERSELDHRSDVFSLGVVLYELLALQRPFEGDSAVQISEGILHVEPPDLSGLCSRLPRDLAVIAGKALEKRREARYASMADLAEDLRRHLAHRPILARPPRPLQRAVKWGRRHPVISASGAVVLVALAVISGLLAQNLAYSADLESQRSTVLAQSVQLERRNQELTASQAETQARNEELRQERDRLATVVTFQEGLFDELDQASLGARLRSSAERDLEDALRTRGHSTEDVAAALAVYRQSTAPLNFTDLGVRSLLEEIVAPAGSRVRSDFQDDPLTQAILASSVARAAWRLADYESALALEDIALTLEEAELGPMHPSTLGTLHDMSGILQAMGRHHDAAPYSQRALSARRRTLGDEHPDTLSSIADEGARLLALGEHAAAESLYREALEVRRRTLGADHPETLTSINNMGFLLDTMGRLEEALPYYEEAYAGERRILGPDDPETLGAMVNLGSALADLGRMDEASSLYVEALAAHRRVLGDEHPQTLGCINNVAYLHHSLGQLDQARVLYEEALASQRIVLGNEHPSTMVTIGNLGGLLGMMGAVDEARPYYGEALRTHREVLGDVHPDTLRCVNNMAVLLAKTGEMEAAVPLFQELAAGSLETFGPAHEQTLGAADQLGIALISVGRSAEALPVLEKAHALAEVELEPGHPLHGMLGARLLRCYQELHRAEPRAGFDARAAELRERMAAEQD